MSPPFLFPQTMNPSIDRLIELATRPFSDNAELKLAADGELRKRIDAHHAQPDEINDAVRRFERAATSRVSGIWRPALYLSALIVSLCVLIPMFGELWLFRQSTLSMAPLTGAPQSPMEDLLGNKRSREQMLLLFGDTRSGIRENRWKPLWDSQRDNPAYLSKHATDLLRFKQDLPDEIQQAVERIDPANGWYDAIRSGMAASDAVTRKSRSYTDRKKHLTPQWEIQDPEKLKQALLHLGKAMEKPGFTNYDAEMLKEQIPLLPVPVDYLSQLIPITYLASQTTTSIHIGRIGSALGAGAQESTNQQDPEKLRRMIADWEQLASKQTRGGTSMVDLLVAKSIIQTPALNFRDAAQSLGLEKEAARFSRIASLQQQAEEEREFQRGKPQPENSLLQQHGSILASMSIPVVVSRVGKPPPLSRVDLDPSRHAEHAFFTRAAFSIAILLFGFLAGLAALHRTIQPRLPRQLSSSLIGLLRASDWMWIIGVGILAPVAWHACIVYFTSCSSREWSFRSNGLQQFGGQIIGLILLIITSSIMITTARIARRGRFIGLKPRRSWTGWLAVVSAALAIPMAGSIMPLATMGIQQTRMGSYVMQLYYVFLAVPLLWLLVGFGKSMLGNPSHALRRSITARVLLPVSIAGSIIMALSNFLLQAEERHWIRKDTLFRILPDQPGLSRYEWQVTQQLRKELLEMMEQTR